MKAGASARGALTEREETSMKAFVVDSISANGIRHIWCHGGKVYSVDMGPWLTEMSEPRYFTDMSDARWYFKRLVTDGDSDVLEAAYEKVEHARQVFNEIMLFMVDDENVLTEDCEFEGLGFYRRGTNPNDVMSDFENVTGVSVDYMYGWEEQPFLAA